jgi:hypothetical protein
MRPPKRFVAVLFLLVSLCCAAAVPAVAGAELPASTPVLAFAGDTAHSVGGEVAVPVECLGESTAFCSGTVTLTRAGQKVTAPFSVEGESDETLFVPLRLEGGAGRPVKVNAAITTLQPLGGPSATRTILLVH